MELLAPVSSLDAFYGAINAGANAVYMGGKFFSARMYANNFSTEEIKEMIKYAHIRNVKVYITINTLLFEDEIERAFEFAKELYLADVDAFLIQDLGFATYLKRRIPDVTLHASTQLNCHNIAEAKALINLGFERIVLAREVSLQEAIKIKELGVEVEVFAQGALCVSYSGNCLMSSFIGTRSGNRGKCAQTCRTMMNLISKEGSRKDKYAISTKDLFILEELDKLIEAGIDSIKIEGRMKREEYIYQAVKMYRHYLDYNKYNPQDKKTLQTLFNREYTKGYLLNESATKLLNQKTSSNIGIPLGKVTQVKDKFIYIKLEDDLSLQDGIKIMNSSLEGTIVTRITKDFKDVKKAYKGEIVAVNRNNIKVNVGDLVHKTTSNEDLLRLKEEMKNHLTLPIKIKIKLKENETFVLELIDDRFNKVFIESDIKLEKANNSPTTKERIITQLSKFDNHPYHLDEIEIDYNDDLFVPIGLINNLRRQALDELDKRRENLNHYSNIVLDYETKDIDVDRNKHLFIKLNQDLDIDIDYLPLIPENLNKEGIRCLDRINHQDNKVEANIMSHYLKEVNDGFNIISMYGNVTNSYTIDCYLERGYKIVFASLECSKRQMKMMIDKFISRHHKTPPLGIYIYGQIDYMIMKSCPIATSFNKDNTHCLKCKEDQFYLQDQFKAKYPLVTNNKCIVRVLSDKRICLFTKLNEIEDLGIKNYLIDFNLETKDEIEKVIEAYKQNKSVSEFYGHFIKEVE